MHEKYSWHTSDDHHTGKDNKGNRRPFPKVIKRTLPHAGYSYLYGGSSHAGINCQTSVLTSIGEYIHQEGGAQLVNCSYPRCRLCCRLKKRACNLTSASLIFEVPHKPVLFVSAY